MKDSLEFKNVCYICKLGWVTGDQYEFTWDRKGLKLCYECYSMLERKSKNE